MINELLFFTHSISIAIGAFVALHFGKHALVSFLCLQSILANLFVIKQITLFGFHVTASDVFSVGCIFSLNLLQEFFGSAFAKKAIRINLFLTFFYFCMTQFHLKYIPNSFDTMQPHYSSIFSIMPRIIIASMTTFFLVQICDTYIYQKLLRLFNKKHFTIRSFIALCFSQFLDTVMFSLLGLYGLVHTVLDIIIISFIIKMIAIIVITSCLTITNQYLRKNHEHKF